MKVRFKRFRSCARVPEKATLGSVCFDVFSARCVTLEPGVTRSIETDIGLKFSKKYMARVYPCSGLSLAPAMLGGGVIDSDFWGIIYVILTNLSKRTIEIETGERIAQMLFLKKEEIEFIEVNEFDKTEGGIKGFGSTGK